MRKNKTDKIYMALVAAVLLFISIFLVITILPTEKITLTSNSTEKIKKNSSRIKNFVGIIVVSVDIQTNTRQMIYYYIRDQLVKEQIDNYFSKKSITITEPLFLKDRSEKEINDRIISLINHQFSCVPYTSTIYSKFIPESSDRIASVCSVAIPPSYGEFSGILSLYLSKEPTSEEKTLIKVILASLSDSISNEVKPH